MPNLLLLSLEGFSVSSRQLYPQLFPKMLSRAVVHESLTAEDALNYIGSGWPNIILVSDSGIAKEHNRDLLAAVVECVKHGCTMICAGFFASTIDYEAMDVIFKEDFELRWRFAEYTTHNVDCHLSLPETMIRKSCLAVGFQAEAVYLGHVPPSEVVYSSKAINLTYAAFARVGLGKLGYIGDVNFSEEVERLILAMAHLDRPKEDSLHGIED
jgi:hypothetical protein